MSVKIDVIKSKLVGVHSVMWMINSGYGSGRMQGSKIPSFYPSVDNGLNEFG